MFKKRIGYGRAIFASVFCLLSFGILAPQAQAVPVAVETPAHATTAIYTNDVLSVAGSVSSNEKATVVYTAEEGWFFADGATVVTNTLDTSVDPAVIAKGEVPPKVGKPTLQLGVVAQRYPWNGKIDVQCRLCYAKTAEATLKVTANGVEKTQDVTLANGVNALVFDAKAAFDEVMARDVKFALKLK